MSLDHALHDALRVALILGVALAAMPLLRRAPARRLVLALAFAGALVLPAISALAPAWHVGHVPQLAMRGQPALEPVVVGAPALDPGVRTAAARPRTVAPVAKISLEAVVASIWALGALLVLARLAVGIARARAMVRRASPADDWTSTVARAELATGLRADVRITDDLDAPAVTGVRAPVVLVPRASAAWGEGRRFAVLVHELAHVRQRDCLAQILAQIVCAVHWFDPLAWLAARRLRLERELAADEAVVAAGLRASAYAGDLVAIASVGMAPAGVLAMAERSQLAVRVSALVASGRAFAPLSRRRATLLAAGTVALVFGIACATPDSRAPEAAAAGSPPGPVSTGSTIDGRLQQIADEELDRTMTEWQAAAGAVVVLDPATGEILANAGRDRGAHADVAVGRAYVTGSTLKAVTLAAALDDGVVAAGDRFDCSSHAYGTRPVEDYRHNGTLTLPQMLAVSTNIGFAKVFDRLGAGRLEHWLRRFHFGAAPPLAGAASGAMPSHVEDRSFEGAVVAIGGTVTASPLQVAAAYAALVNDGVYLVPTLSRSATRPAGERLARPETARAVVAMLEEAVNSDLATGKRARVAASRVAGKTGTAKWDLPQGGEGVYSSFVGILVAAPRKLVILVGVEGPHGGESGGEVAAPAFARIATRALGE